MFKTNNERIRQALDAISKYAGTHRAREVDELLRRPPGFTTMYGNALALPGFGKSRGFGDSTHRDAMRACILVGLVYGRFDVAAVPAVVNDIKDWSNEALQRKIQHQMPFRPLDQNSANLSLWDPRHFTAPKSGPANSYRFIIHGIMADPSQVARIGANGFSTKKEWDKLLETFDKSIVTIEVVSAQTPLESQKMMVNFASQYLGNISLIQRNIISASVISDAKHPSYYPFGFILKVPADNVYSTSGKDQEINNRVDPKNVLSTLQGYSDSGRRGKVAGTIQSPDEVLQATNKADGNEGYNEVVLVGTGPTGSRVEVSGIYVKVNPDGKLYIDPRRNAPTVTPKLVDLIKKCSQTNNIPVVKIVDKTSKMSAVAADFG